MKFKISYFYQIRFFKPNQIPLSTALFDPTWYHQGLGEHHIFKDANGVINGLRIKLLNPTTSECGPKCPRKGQKDCPFKSHYYEHLESIDFNNFINTLELDINTVAAKWGIKDPEVVFIVYETPDNPCSEREGLIRRFFAHGCSLEEFKKVDKPKTINLFAK